MKEVQLEVKKNVKIKSICMVVNIIFIHKNHIELTPETPLTHYARCLSHASNTKAPSSNIAESASCKVSQIPNSK